MYVFLLGVGALALFLWAGRKFANANPADLSRSLQRAGGIVAVLVGAVLTLAGRAAFGVPLAAFGVSLLLRSSKASFGQRSTRSAGGTSSVRSAMLAMELDIDSGTMRGVVMSGPYAGRELDALNDAELIDLLQEVSSRDADGLPLIEAYLDRRMPRWREDLQGNAGARSHHPPRESAMTENEAYEILGLDPGAAAAEIRRAHRSLMKKLHPDQGGSNYLASRVNQAKDLLLRTQR